MQKFILFLFLFLLSVAGNTLSLHGASRFQATDSLARISRSFSRDTLPTPVTPPKKQNFFHRFYNYFADANEDKTEIKKFDFSIIGGPHYSEDIKLGLGLVAAGQFRIDKTDLSIPPSNVSFFGDITTTGFYLLGIRGNTLFKRAKFRLDYNAYFFSMPSSFWGIGYDNAINDNNASSYKRLQNQLKIDFLFRIANNTYIGPNVSFNYIEGKHFSNPKLLQGESAMSVNAGIGFSLIYDSRDYITSASRGMYLNLEQRFFPKFMSNGSGFTRTEFITDFYQQAWKNGVVAFDLHGMFNYGTPPWTMLSLMGGSYRMRGYYEGRYRDRNLIEAQVELRQRVYRRIGATAWVGAGNVFHSFNRFNFSQVLPNYGLGLRWEFKQRVNVRLDYGFGKNQSGFLFQINEAF